MSMLTYFPGFEALLLRAVLYFTTWLSSSRHKGQKGNLPFFAAKISPPCEGLSDVRASNGLHRAYNFR